MTSSCRLLATAASLLALGACADHPPRTSPASPTFRLSRTITLDNVGIPPNAKPTASGLPGRLDHLAYDPVTDRLFIAALEQGSLEVVDLAHAKRTARVEGLSRPQGIAIARAPELPHSGWVVVACGGDGTVHAYDAATLAPAATATAGENADNVRFDAHRTIYVGTGGNDGAGAIITFDAANLARNGSIPLPLRPESFQLDPRPGHAEVFANTPGAKAADNDGSVVVADRTGAPLLASWNVPGAARNFPLAFDPGSHRLFFACRKPARVFCLDSDSGAILSQSPCVADSDDLFFDPKRQRLYIIGGGRRPADPATPHAPTPGADAALEVFSVDAAGHLTRTGSFPTAPHARTGLFVPSRNAVYVVAPPHDALDARVLEFVVTDK